MRIIIVCDVSECYIKDKLIEDPIELAGMTQHWFEQQINTQHEVFDPTNKEELLGKITFGENFHTGVVKE